MGNKKNENKNETTTNKRKNIMIGEAIKVLKGKAEDFLLELDRKEGKAPPAEEVR